MYQVGPTRYMYVKDIDTCDYFKKKVQAQLGNTQREFQRWFHIFFLTWVIQESWITFIMDRKKRLRYPHTPNEAAIDCKRRREEPCII